MEQCATNPYTYHNTKKKRQETQRKLKKSKQKCPKPKIVNKKIDKALMKCSLDSTTKVHFHLYQNSRRYGKGIVKCFGFINDACVAEGEGEIYGRLAKSDCAEKIIQLIKSKEVEVDDIMYKSVLSRFTDISSSSVSPLPRPSPPAEVVKIHAACIDTQVPVISKTIQNTQANINVLTTSKTSRFVKTMTEHGLEITKAIDTRKVSLLSERNVMGKAASSLPKATSNKPLGVANRLVVNINSPNVTAIRESLTTILNQQPTDWQSMAVNPTSPSREVENISQEPKKQYRGRFLWIRPEEAQVTKDCNAAASQLNLSTPPRKRKSDHNDAEKQLKKPKIEPCIDASGDCRQDTHVTPFSPMSTPGRFQHASAALDNIMFGQTASDKTTHPLKITSLTNSSTSDYPRTISSTFQIPTTYDLKSFGTSASKQDDLTMFVSQDGLKATSRSQVSTTYNLKSHGITASVSNSVCVATSTSTQHGLKAPVSRTQIPASGQTASQSRSNDLVTYSSRLYDQTTSSLKSHDAVSTTVRPLRPLTALHDVTVSTSNDPAGSDAMSQSSFRATDSQTHGHMRTSSKSKVCAESGSKSHGITSARSTNSLATSSQVRTHGAVVPTESGSKSHGITSARSTNSLATLQGDMTSISQTTPIPKSHGQTGVGLVSQTASHCTNGIKPGNLLEDLPTLGCKLTDNVKDVFSTFLRSNEDELEISSKITSKDRQALFVICDCIGLHFMLFVTKNERKIIVKKTQFLKEKMN